MSNDENKERYFLDDYKNDVLFIRKDFYPLIFIFGKRKWSVWVTVPPFKEGTPKKSEFFKWFHSDFVEIVNFVAKKRNITLEEDQTKPSWISTEYGWYLPVGIVFELIKMWNKDHIPFMFDLARPADVIYGRGWTRADMEEVVELYLQERERQEFSH